MTARRSIAKLRLGSVFSVLCVAGLGSILVILRVAGDVAHIPHASMRRGVVRGATVDDAIVNVPPVENFGHPRPQSWAVKRGARSDGRVYTLLSAVTAAAVAATVVYVMLLCFRKTVKGTNDSYNGVTNRNLAKWQKLEDDYSDCDYSIGTAEPASDVYGGDEDLDDEDARQHSTNEDTTGVDPSETSANALALRTHLDEDEKAAFSKIIQEVFGRFLFWQDGQSSYAKLDDDKPTMFADTLQDGDSADDYMMMRKIAHGETSSESSAEGTLESVVDRKPSGGQATAVLIDISTEPPRDNTDSDDVSEAETVVEQDTAKCDEEDPSSSKADATIGIPPSNGPEGESALPVSVTTDAELAAELEGVPLPPETPDLRWHPGLAQRLFTAIFFNKEGKLSVMGGGTIAIIALLVAGFVTGMIWRILGIKDPYDIGTDLMVGMLLMSVVLMGVVIGIDVEAWRSWRNTRKDKAIKPKERMHQIIGEYII